MEIEENKELKNIVNNNKNISNIVNKIQKLLLNYDLMIAYIQGEIGLRDSEIECIDSVVASSNKKDYTKTQLKKTINLKADKKVFEHVLEKTLERRNRVLESICMIFDRLKDAEKIKHIFVEFYLKNKSLDEITLEMDIEEFTEIKKIIDSILINVYQ